MARRGQVAGHGQSLNKPDEFQLQLRRLHEALGIPEQYVGQCKLPLCREPAELVDTELDFYQRPQKLTEDAFAAWTAMKTAAAEQGVSLFLISAFRGLQYQHDLIARKLQEGRTLEQILTVNAAPGFSEHHSGRAIDVGTLNCDAVVLEFENTDAFQWLKENAGSFDFYMSYPRNNPYGIDYEPWHWCFQTPAPGRL